MKINKTSTPKLIYLKQKLEETNQKESQFYIHIVDELNKRNQ